MTDYYGALREAVGNLRSDGRLARRAFFNRARRLVIERLQTADPPVPARELRAEIDAFDAAVARIEQELTPPPRRAPPPAAPAVRQTSPPPPQAQRPAPPPPPRSPQVPQQSPQQPSHPPHAATQRPQPSSREPSRAAGRVANEVSGVGGTPRTRPHDAPPTPVPSPPLRRGRGTSAADSRSQIEDAGLTPSDEIYAAAPDTSDAQHRTELHHEIVSSAHHQPRLRPGMLIGAGVLVVAAALGYVLWGRDDGSPPPAAPRPAPAEKTTAAAPAKADDAPGANIQYVLRRQLVYYRTVQPPGTIVIAKSQHFLYVVRPDSVGLRYTFGMGPDCAALAGLYKISRNDGADAKTRALSIGDTKCNIRMIEPSGNIGQSLRTPGIQLAEDDFTDLFDHTNPDARVVITN